LNRDGYFAPGDAMLDIGASELFCSAQPGVLNDFLRFFGAEPYVDVDLQRMANRAFAAELFRRAGFRYTAIDYSNFRGIVRLDLNKKRLPWRHRGRYQFVANTGTSEHILNQYNVFEVIHEAAKPGGIMYHGVPAWGDYEHGIFNYTPKFFWALAKANDYKFIRFWGWSDELVAPLKPEFMEAVYFRKAPL